MADFDTVIRNAVVATAADVFRSDIGIAGGVITALGRSLEPARREIDAGGRYVLPGGIDAHCHFDQPMRDSVTLADDFLSGPISAAHGGTTTVVPFACQLQGQSVRTAVEDYHRRAAGKPVIDYAFHLIISDPTEDVLRRELPALIGEGYSSFKIYMTYETLKLNDRQIISVLAVARREGAMVMVHAENSDCITWLTEELERAGRTAPRFHAPSRPQAVEREGTHRAITMSEIVDVPILLVHVSAADAVEQIRWGQGRGLRIFAETCPQYLVLTADHLDAPGFEGAKYVCSPPPRDVESQEAIWRGLRSGVFHVFSSDHAAFRFDHPEGKKRHGTDAPFRKVPNGVLPVSAHDSRPSVGRTYTRESMDTARSSGEGRDGRFDGLHAEAKEALGYSANTLRTIRDRYREAYHEELARWHSLRDDIDAMERVSSTTVGDPRPAADDCSRRFSNYNCANAWAQFDADCPSLRASSGPK
jgi:dihydropyrimidinase